MSLKTFVLGVAVLANYLVAGAFLALVIRSIYPLLTRGL